MTTHGTSRGTLRDLDDATQALVRLAVVISAGTDHQVMDAIARARNTIPPEWVEELILQTHLFAGFPRALNAMRAWRRVSPEPVSPASTGGTSEWRETGETTCAAVYGDMYERLRQNIRHLHPALDDWMIVEGYGKVLSRPGLDLARRELCIVAACAASGQDRQLHSHLHGARNVGVEPGVLDGVIDAIADLLGDARARSVRLLWARVRGK
jgi:4-carboxymuconolactone decarboxylase